MRRRPQKTTVMQEAFLLALRRRLARDAINPITIPTGDRVDPRELWRVVCAIACARREQMGARS